MLAKRVKHGGISPSITRQYDSVIPATNMSDLFMIPTPTPSLGIIWYLFHNETAFMWDLTNLLTSNCGDGCTSVPASSSVQTSVCEHRSQTHALNECVLKEVGQPEGDARAVLRVLQFLQDSFDDPMHSCDGKRNHWARLDASRVVEYVAHCFIVEWLLPLPAKKGSHNEP